MGNTLYTMRRIKTSSAVGKLKPITEDAGLLDLSVVPRSAGKVPEDGLEDSVTEIQELQGEEPDALHIDSELDFMRIIAVLNSQLFERDLKKDFNMLYYSSSKCWIENGLGVAAIRSIVETNAEHGQHGPHALRIGTWTMGVLAKVM